MTDLSHPRPALAQMFRERADRMVNNNRGYWDSRGVLINNPEKCKQKVKELRDIAAQYDDPKLYEQFVED